MGFYSLDSPQHSLCKSKEKECVFDEKPQRVTKGGGGGGGAGGTGNNNNGAVAVASPRAKKPTTLILKR